MKSIQAIPAKNTYAGRTAKAGVRWRLQNKRIVFTNGVFDILHEGHIASLSEAASYGDILVVGLNSDSSVKRLKGPERPYQPGTVKSIVLASLVMTDVIVLFEEDTPLQLITAFMPDILVKGGDYTVEQIAGAKEVLAAGGEVKIAKIIDGVSTTGIIEKMKTGNKN
jgi:D-beta-D-heptose 7-phosphate kinase/D-beta-D-heptose 1-phosphate adenosyltransferase